MARVKRGNKRRMRRKKILSYAKGYFLTKHNCYRMAKLQVDRSLLYAYRDRRQKKRQFRSLWIARIGAAARSEGISYSRFMHGLSQAGIVIDRKQLADIALRDAAAFQALVQRAKGANA